MPCVNFTCKPPEEGIGKKREAGREGGKEGWREREEKEKERRK